MPSQLKTRALPVSMALVVLIALSGCSSADGPELTAAERPTATAEPEPTPTPAPTAQPTAVASPTPEPEPTPEPSTRGISADTVRIGVIHTERSFGDVDLGVAARLARPATADGLGGRTIELVEVIDDGGDPEATLDAARRLVEEQEVFAVVLASTVPERAVTDYLAAQQVPFFGWGFAAGFCEPNRWGHGFNGCLNGAALGVVDAATDVSGREVIRALAGDDARVVLVVSDDAAGEAARLTAETVWGDSLLGVVSDRAEPEGANEADEADAAVMADIEALGDADVVVLSVGLERTLDFKPMVLETSDAIVIDDVSYVPGLLGDAERAAMLDGGHALTQFPPQEEYREATGVVAEDLAAVDDGLIWSQAFTIGYWSTDLLVAVLDATGEDLDTATFQTTVADGVTWEPGFEGAPCGFDTATIHRDPAGGAALVQVEDGIYRPVVPFQCHTPEPAA